MTVPTRDKVDDMDYRQLQKLAMLRGIRAKDAGIRINKNRIKKKLRDVVTKEQIADLPLDSDQWQSYFNQWDR